MRTGPYKLLRDFAQKHPNTRSALNHWYELKVLIHTVSTHKNDDFIPLTEDDYDSLVVLLDELTDVVREDENHFFSSLMEFVVVLIEKYDHAHNPELAARIQRNRAKNASNTENDLVAG